MRTVLTLIGPDAERYLNGQITNDVRKATADEAVAACVTDAKGKLQAVCEVLRIEGGFRIEADCDDAEALFDRLDRYLIADDCELELVESGEREALSPQANDERIRAGKPLWGAELVDGILPPEAGLDATHIAYDKGCYIGQEVISRIKSVGRVNRSLKLLSFPAGGVSVGDEIVDGRGEVVGTVTSCTSDSQQGLALIHRLSEEPLTAAGHAVTLA